MSEIIQAIRGMNDVLPNEAPLWQYVENVLQQTAQSYGFQEMRTPVLEKTDLFKRSIGEVTDIVEKEMYTFLDRNEESLTLRPEGTACCVRAGIEHGLLYNQIQRFWYNGPYFRYEKPQKGRYRQFHQFGAEVFGLEGPDIDAELIMMSATMLDKLDIRSQTTLQLNSLGTSETRNQYRHQLTQYFEKHKGALDEDSKRRLLTNPLRILDSKNPEMQSVIAKAPKLLDHLDSDSLNHFEKLQHYLRLARIDFEINPCLVRGLDYYTKTVFEWVTTKLGAQGALCSGGRYDGLVKQLGGKSTPALGFGLGMERVILLMQQVNSLELEPTLHVYFVIDGEAAFEAGLNLAQHLRTKVPGLKILLHTGGGNLKNQFKKADKSGAQFALILGEHELKTHSVTLKHLREDLPQQTLITDELAEFFKLHVAKNRRK